MKALGKVVVALGIAAVAVVGGSIALEQAGVETPLNAARNGAANAALDATGLKEKADAALRANV